MPEVQTVTPASPRAEQMPDQLLEIPIRGLVDNAELNVRSVNSHEEGIRELAASIMEQGILEPVVVTPAKEKGTWRLVFGFRRVAAARLAGLVSVPAIARRLTEEEIREAQLVENLQRTDLSPIEEAKAFRSYLAGGHTQVNLAKRIGKSQPYVAKRIGLLELPEKGAKLLEQGKISPSAAEQLVALPKDAHREVNRAFGDLERKAGYRGGVTVEEAKWAADSAMRSFRERQRKEKAITSAKFPVCPVKGCGKAGRPWASWGPSTFKDSAGHEWDPKSGKVSAREPVRSYAQRQPPKPTLPLVDEDVPLSIPVQQVSRRVVEAIKSVHSCNVSWKQGTRAMIEMDVELPSLKGAKAPGFRMDDGHKFLTLELADSWYQRDDRGRERAAKARAELVAWLETFGRRKSSTRPSRTKGK